MKLVSRVSRYEAPEAEVLDVRVEKNILQSGDPVTQQVQNVSGWSSPEEDW